MDATILQTHNRLWQICKFLNYIAGSCAAWICFVQVCEFHVLLSQYDSPNLAGFIKSYKSLNFNCSRQGSVNLLFSYENNAKLARFCHTSDVDTWSQVSFLYSDYTLIWNHVCIEEYISSCNHCISLKFHGLMVLNCRQWIISLRRWSKNLLSSVPTSESWRSRFGQFSVNLVHWHCTNFWQPRNLQRRWQTCSSEFFSLKRIEREWMRMWRGWKRIKRGWRRMWPGWKLW